MNKLNSDFDPADHCGNCIDAKRAARTEKIVVAGGLAFIAVLATISHITAPNPHPSANLPAPRPRVPATANAHPVSPEVAAAQHQIIESVEGLVVAMIANEIVEFANQFGEPKTS